MNWIPNNHKPQLTVDCPTRFRGTSRYVSQSDCRPDPPPVDDAMPYGKYRDTQISNVPTGYLRWFSREVNGRALLMQAVRSELAKRESAAKN